MELIFQNQKLEDLEVSELPIFYQARAEAFRRSHPWLRGSDLRGQLAAWPSLQDAYPALVGGTSALEMAAQLGEAFGVQWFHHLFGTTRSLLVLIRILLGLKPTYTTLGSCDGHSSWHFVT